MSAELTATSLFAGIGGFCLGFQQAGIPTVQAIECDEFAVKTYRANFPHVRVIEADIRNVSVESHDIRSTDVIHAGFPCQSFSQAGARRGFSDPRGELVFDALRLIRELGEDRPSVIVLENAPNFSIGQGGAWFLRLSKEIKKAGYWFRDANCAQLDPYEVTSLPQQRNRLFMVAFATNRFRNGKFTFPTTRNEKEKRLSKFIDFNGEQDPYYYLDSENRYYKMISKHITGDPAVYQLRKYVVRAKAPNVCPTLTANMGQGGHNVPFVQDAGGLRKLTEVECATLQGFPKSFKFPAEVPRAQRYTQIGNAVCVPVVKLLAKCIRQKIEEERQ